MYIIFSLLKGNNATVGIVSVIPSERLSQLVFQFSKLQKPRQTEADAEKVKCLFRKPYEIFKVTCHKLVKHSDSLENQNVHLKVVVWPVLVHTSLSCFFILYKKKKYNYSECK